MAQRAFILPHNQSKSQRQGNYHPERESPSKTKRDAKELKWVHETKIRCVMYGYDGYGSIAKTQGKQDYPHHPPLEPTRSTAQEKQSPNILIFWKRSRFGFWYYSTPRLWSSFFACPYPVHIPPPCIFFLLCLQIACKTANKTASSAHGEVFLFPTRQVFTHQRAHTHYSYIIFGVFPLHWVSTTYPYYISYYDNIWYCFTINIVYSKNKR